MWKRWVGLLADEGHIERPRNLLSREFMFTVTSVPQVPELAEIKEFLKSLQDEPIRLYALVCLNGGLNNADIGQLHNTDHGWKKAQSLLEQGKIDCGHIDWRQRQKSNRGTSFTAFQSVANAGQSLASAEMK